MGIRNKEVKTWLSKNAVARRRIFLDKIILKII
jgi:hypothetical protein